MNSTGSPRQYELIVTSPSPEQASHLRICAEAARSGVFVSPHSVRTICYWTIALGFSCGEEGGI